MCDTIVALGKVTADGVTLFGKNSDREPNEAHHVIRVPAGDHAPGSMVKCTYIEIPQAAHMYEVLLTKPFWIWGAEMGANEHGLVIGNEAVFTKVPYDKMPGLIGMDFLRLALERAKSAYEALTVITDLLSQYGQGGNCGFRHATFYHNIFLMADPREAWVLETAGRQWAAVRVEDVRSISNGLTIGDHWDLASDDLVNFAVEKGWCKGKQDFHFARCYSDFLYTRFSRCNERQCRTTDLLQAQKGSITPQTLFASLRDHGEGAGTDWTPARGLSNFTVCAHAGFGPIRGTGSNGSMVSHLGEDVQTHFVTATAAPCTSVFKPLWLGMELPETGPIPNGEYDASTLFWRHEALHRAILRDYVARITLIREEQAAAEQRFVAGALSLRLHAEQEREAFARQCFAEADQLEAAWLGQIRKQPVQKKNPLLYDFAWQGFNREAKMPAGFYGV